MRLSWSKTTVAPWTAQLRTVYYTSFMFLNNVSKVKQNNSCAVWIMTSFKEQQSCAQFFSQVLCFKTIRPYWRKTTVVRYELGSFSNNSTAAHSLFYKSYVFTNASTLKQNNSCAVWIRASFKQQLRCARYASVPHRLFYKFYVYKQCVQVKAKQQVRSVNESYFQSIAELET